MECLNPYCREAFAVSDETQEVPEHSLPGAGEKADSDGHYLHKCLGSEQERRLAGHFGQQLDTLPPVEGC